MELGRPFVHREGETRSDRRGQAAVLVAGVLIGALGASLVITAPAVRGGIVAPTTLAADEASKLALVGGIFQTFFAGGFVGSDAEANAAKFFSKDAIFDFTANILEPLYKVYHGPAGVLEFCKGLSSAFEFTDFVPSIFMGPGGKVMSRNSATLTLKSTGVTRHVVDYGEFEVAGGKVVSSKTYFGDQLAYAEMWATETTAVVEGLFQAWVAGELNGPKGAEVAAKFFTEDAVIDATADIKGTDGFKVYHGIAGMSEWTAFLATFDIKGVVPQVFNGPEPNTVVVKTSFASWTSKKTGKTTGKHSDFMFCELVDGRVSSLKLYYGNPAGFEGILN